MNFEIENTPFEHSFAHQLFRKHFTEINKVYWANFVVESTVLEQVGNYRKSHTQDKPIDFFQVDEADKRKLENSFDEWLSNYTNFSNMTRQNMILSLCSILEIYLKSITLLAIEARPGVIFGDQGDIKGSKLLKHSDTYADSDKNNLFHRYVKLICEGDWPSRVREYKKLFGCVPDALQLKNNVQDLETMRKLRNRIAHQFGRDESEKKVLVTLNVRPAEVVEPEDFIKYLDLVGKVEEAIDDHLYFSFIGSYEVLRFYHEHNRKKTTTSDILERAKWLRKEIQPHFTKSPGTDYCKGLIAYYNSL